MNNYSTALRKVQGLQGVERAVIISTEGEILAAIGLELSEDAAENVANHCADFLQMAREFALLTQRGNLESVGIGIPENSRVRFIFIDHKTILIVELNQHASLTLFYQDLFGYGLLGGPIFPWRPRNSEYTQVQGVTERQQTESYVTALKKLQATNEDIESAALIGVDGRLLAWSWLVSDEDAQKIATLCAEFARKARGISNLTDRGDMDFVAVRMQARYVYFAPVGERYFLAILTRKDAKLGLLSQQIKAGALADR
jgi:predicted regulator of Ras-like GTPase activity (Roadblock/LC7/MglB family)